MTWNYRVVHRYGIAHGRRWDELAVHEVYYDGETPATMTVDEVSPAGETIEELQSSWMLYQNAFEKPVRFYDLDQDCFTDANAWEKHALEHSSASDNGSGGGIATSRNAVDAARNWQLFLITTYLGQESLPKKQNRNW